MKRACASKERERRVIRKIVDGRSYRERSRTRQAPLHFTLLLIHLESALQCPRRNASTWSCSGRVPGVRKEPRRRLTSASESLSSNGRPRWEAPRCTRAPFPPKPCAKPLFI